MLQFRVQNSICYLKQISRCLSNFPVPFHEDLTNASDDDFGLSDFHHYTESPDVLARTSQLLKEVHTESSEPIKVDFKEICELKKPLVFVSKLSNPYLNLAIEDYIYNLMPIPTDKSVNYNRLLFYINNPCVVIGKNQNPWNEANLPLLNSLKLPLIRRKSGGGTVVHDKGNVNFSFMTTKQKFDRHLFTNFIASAINKSKSSKYELEVNERGDLTTTKQEDGINYKVSGSAYKLSKGKSYHHGTMLLNSRLDILSKLLTRDKSLGIVDTKSSVESVRSKVINIGTEEENFINTVTKKFEEEFALEQSEEQFEQNDMFGLNDFVEANKSVETITIDESIDLPHEIIQTSNELQEWKWRFGSTPSFSHKLINDEFNFSVEFSIGKHGYLEDFTLSFEQTPDQRIIDSFEFLSHHIKTHKLEYIGSNIAGFITHDKISDWVGEKIDGTN